ncbi:MAG: hypothetical protein L0338_39135 [Acidobacteria bacterium]|nr:hypothetical protein [Acidobacteriota bacterium]
MSYVSPLNLSSDEVVCYLKREASQLGPLFISLNGNRRILVDSLLTLAELSDDERLLTLHYPFGQLRVRGHQLGELFEDARRGRLGEVRECGGPARSEGLWVDRFEWGFPIEQDDLASVVKDATREFGRLQ